MTNTQAICAVILAALKPAVVLGCVWFGWWLRGKTQNRRNQ